MASPNIRALAARTLAPVIAKGQSLSALFEPALEKVDAKDRGLFQQLCFGTLRQYYQLQAIANQLLDKPLRSKDCDVSVLILLGLFQILHLRTPDHAAISETVNASRKLKKPWASKLINGLLRNFLRNRSDIESQLAKNPEYTFSHPQWFIDKLVKSWPEHYQAILQSNNQQPPVCLRVNQQQTDREQYLQQLRELPIAAEPLATNSTGIRLLESADIRSLPGFTQGHFSVQDEAAQLAAELLNLQPQQRVLDACAAPGGKSCHILEREPALKELLCVDLEATRMERVKQNLQRLQLSASLKVADVGKLKIWWDGVPFDRILLDAPCSATGVIRRHPDIKLLRRESDLAKLGALQLELLKTLWQTLLPGGELVYATCSVLPDENESIIQQFLKQQPDAQHQTINATWGLGRPFGRQLFPQAGGHDGFYYARLYKAL
nr:16S rRNA (cytosine(967)-C(5))-methyltransferase RsmB [Teredinibacter haidensis]